jgi:hypothetical protein
VEGNDYLLMYRISLKTLPPQKCEIIFANQCRDVRTVPGTSTWEYGTVQ